MVARVFISHSSKDSKVARTICSALESRGLPCWIASRDVGPGENFMEAIVRAIRAAKVMVLVFSENANNSDEIKREIVLAGNAKVTVIPVRVEDVVPGDALAYQFATRQWIDLFDDWEGEIERLAKWIIPPVPAETAGAVTSEAEAKAGLRHSTTDSQAIDADRRREAKQRAEEEAQRRKDEAEQADRERQRAEAEERRRAQAQREAEKAERRAEEERARREADRAQQKRRAEEKRIERERQARELEEKRKAEEERRREEEAASARLQAQREAEQQARRNKEEARLVAIAGFITKGKELANWDFVKATTRRWLLQGLGWAVVAVGIATWVELQPGELLWRVLYDQSIRTFAGHSVAVNSVAFSPDGRTALSGSGTKHTREIMFFLTVSHTNSVE